MQLPLQMTKRYKRYLLGIKRGIPKKMILHYERGSYCHFCNAHLTLGSGTTDHLYPKALGGTNQWSNLVLACHRCNQDKSTLTEEQFFHFLAMRLMYARYPQHGKQVCYNKIKKVYPEAVLMS